ncbi:MAG: L-glyceraldehyde 3-phosphate reductase [Clostridiaceae bacterium]|nr:L-glyceraldehyde 3-phosphate reductase [Clostridiaceae bacterium]
MYQAEPSRYQTMKYNRLGKSGLKLSAISLGLWHNFGDVDSMTNMKAIVTKAFDMGITHFDLANNYGPPPGSAERNFGRILKEELAPYRDELIISTKAGYTMWDGPYGDFGSRKYLLASLDQSLKRMGLDYVDIFYHHRPDYDTPVEESMLALDSAVRQGKALYVGISNYKREDTKKAYEILKELKTPFVIHQPRYSILDRWIEEDGLKDYAAKIGIGIIAFSPLAQGMFTNRYLKGIPEDSRAGRGVSPFLTKSKITDEQLKMIECLNRIAVNRGQSLAQMALSWVLRDEGVASVLVGASKVSQLEDNVRCIDNTNFTEEELKAIDSIVFRNSH